jgi:hypothetical protein
MDFFKYIEGVYFSMILRQMAAMGQESHSGERALHV